MDCASLRIGDHGHFSIVLDGSFRKAQPCLLVGSELLQHTELYDDIRYRDDRILHIQSLLPAEATAQRPME
jgi:hypothetical protein